MAHTWADNGYGLDECECEECKSYWQKRLSEFDLTESFNHVKEINARLGEGAVCVRCETLLDVDENGNFCCECSKKYVRENTLLIRIIKSREIRGWTPPMYRHSTIETLVEYLKNE